MQVFIVWAICLNLALLAAYDYLYKLLPDRFILSLFGLLGLRLALGQASLLGQRLMVVGMLYVISSLILLVLEKASQSFLLGRGDLKLWSCLSLDLGWRQSLSVLFIASILANLVFLYRHSRIKFQATNTSNNQLLAFGPFIIAGYYLLKLSIL